MDYFYEKRYRRSDGETYVKRYSRSFPLGNISDDDNPVDSQGQSNVRDSSISRARSNVRLIAFANPQLTGLLTLTNKDIPTEDEAQRRFDLFRRKVSKKYKNWQFLGVKELQARGSIHWHLLVNYCPGKSRSPNNPARYVSNLWEYGFSDYSDIHGDDRWRTELYLLKYLVKGTEKLFRSYYVRSRNLNKIDPRYIDTREPIHPLARNIYRTSIMSIKDVAGFDILEYTYNIKVNKGNI